MASEGNSQIAHAAMTEGLRIYTLQSGAASGIENMAFDEALLETLRAVTEPVLIVRTYRWEEPTLSLGVNQQVRDIQFLLEFYGQQAQSVSPQSFSSRVQAGGSTQKNAVKAVVRRPTGGRAILHGEDISYSFITNDPVILKLSLKASYTVYADIVRQALAQLALSVQSAETAGERDYLRSPVCFETHTPSDLLGEDGKKLTGSAQLRRAGGLLQHGAAFLAPYGVDETTFSQALFDAAAQAFQLPVEAFKPTQFEGFASHFETLRVDYATVSGGILANVPTMSGSHLAPASF